MEYAGGAGTHNARPGQDAGSRHGDGGNCLLLPDPGVTAPRDAAARKIDEPISETGAVLSA